MSSTHRTLKYFTRNDAPIAAAYGSSAPLPPRSTFEEFPEVLDAYDGFTRVRDTMRDNLRQAAEKRAAAGQARDEYRTAIAEAINAGADTTKVPNHEARLLAESEAHSDTAAKAKVMVSAAGIDLGRLVQAHGADCFADAEAQMAEAEEEIRGLVQALEDASNRWGDAWSLRRHLSHVVNSGGTSNGYQSLGASRHVLDAIAALRSTLGELADLKGEEALLAEWRQTQAAAQSANERLVGGARPK